MDNKLKTLLIALAFIAIALFYHFGYPGINDGDTFYHFRHASIYREQGIFSTEFPWASASVVSRYASDIWYGFHLALIPFTYFPDEITGMKIAGVFLTSAVLFAYFWVLKYLGVRYPALWTLLILFSTADQNYRFTMIRPHLVTFALAMMILAFAANPVRSSHRALSPTSNSDKNGIYPTLKTRSVLASNGANRRTLAVGITSAILAFFHLSLAWLSVLVTLAIAFSALIDRWFFAPKASGAALPDRTNIWKYFLPVIASITGSAVGWILRPNPFGALKIAYVQVVQLTIEKMNKIPIRFGTELNPSDLSIFIHQLAQIIVLLVLALLFLIVLARRGKFSSLPLYLRIALLGSLGLSFFFELLTNFVARRSMDLWLGFGFIFIALVWTRIREESDLSIRKYLQAGYLISAVAMLFMFANTFYYSSLYRARAFSPERFKDGAEWLKTNAAPGEIVFNLHWDDFPFLFFHNPKNFYISGMDPIFEYAFDKRLYWEHYFLDIDRIYLADGEGYSCPEFQCTGRTVIPIDKILKDDFGASYAFILPTRNPKVYEFLSSSPKFEKVFETEGKEAIFRVL